MHHVDVDLCSRYAAPTGLNKLRGEAATDMEMIASAAVGLHIIEWDRNVSAVTVSYGLNNVFI